MKQIGHGFGVAVALFCFSCGDPTGDYSETGRGTSLPIAKQRPQSLGGSLSLPASLPEGKERNLDNLSRRLSEVTGSPMEVTETADSFLLEGTDHFGEVSKGIGHFSINRRETTGEKGIDTRARYGSEEELLETARLLTGDLGAHTDELERAVVRRVGSRSSKGVARVINQKVFIFRQIVGLEVPLNRSVVTFDLEGRLESLRGIWTPVENAGDRLSPSVSTTEEELFDTGLAAALEKYPHLDPSDPDLAVSTHLNLVEDNGVFRGELRGEVRVPISGPDGTRRFTMLPFGI